MEYDVAIIGGGIVGLSVGYNLLKKKPGLKIAILEKENSLALHQTGRNSGVIHSGIYYKPGSHKAVNCKKGYHRLISFCDENEIDYEICGKIIVATNKNEIPGLHRIYQRGIENGLEGLKLLDKDEIALKEPHVAGERAIWVPQTGIVDYRKIAEKLGILLKERECDILLNHKVDNITVHSSGHQIHSGEKIINTRFLVNCAGLHCDTIAKMQGVELKAKIIPFKGEYFLIKKSRQYLVKNLIYPVPDPNFPFLGVHFTRRINGAIDAGPNAVLALKREGYGKLSIKISEFLDVLFYSGFLKVARKYYKTGAYELYRSLNKRAFTKALQKLIPEINSSDLVKARPGIRAQLCDDGGNLIDDFMIKYNGNAIHVLNAPSPAATSSLQIGDTVADSVIEKF